MLKPIQILLFLPVVMVTLASAPRAAEGDDMVLRRGADGRLESSIIETPAVTASASVAPAETGTSTTTQSLRLWGGLLIGGGAALLWFWQKKRGGPVGAVSVKRLKLIERLSLGARREIILIQACDRLIVVGCNANQMSMLSDLAADGALEHAFGGDVVSERAATKRVTDDELVSKIGSNRRRSNPPEGGTPNNAAAMSSLLTQMLAEKRQSAAVPPPVDHIQDNVSFNPTPPPTVRVKGWPKNGENA